MEEAREHLNFSDWDSYPDEAKSELKEKIDEEISEDKMPLKKYLYLHKNATLSQADVAILRSWMENTY